MGKFLFGALLGIIITSAVFSLIKRLNSNHEDFKLENEQLKSKLARKEKEIESLMDEVERQKRSLRSEQERYDILKDKQEVVSAENLKLKKIISKMQNE